MSGTDLLRTIIEATGLPPNIVERELRLLLEKNGLSAETLSLDDFRTVLSSYLLEIMSPAKEASQSDL